MKSILARILDGSKFSEFKSLFGLNLVSFMNASVCSLIAPTPVLSKLKLMLYKFQSCLRLLLKLEPEITRRS